LNGQVGVLVHRAFAPSTRPPGCTRSGGGFAKTVVLEHLVDAVHKRCRVERCQQVVARIVVRVAADGPVDLFGQRVRSEHAPGLDQPSKVLHPGLRHDGIGVQRSAQVGVGGRSQAQEAAALVLQPQKLVDIQGSCVTHHVGLECGAEAVAAHLLDRLQHQRLTKQAAASGVWVQWLDGVGDHLNLMDPAGCVLEPRGRGELRDQLKPSGVIGAELGLFGFQPQAQKPSDQCLQGFSARRVGG